MTSSFFLDVDNSFLKSKQNSNAYNTEGTELMTNQLKNVKKPTSASTNGYLDIKSAELTNNVAVKSLENVALHSPISAIEDTEATGTPPFASFLFNNLLVRKHAPYLRTLASAAKAHTRTASDANGRSAALERAYVHDVYEKCDEATGAIRPRVAQFLNALEPGSIVCDVGCGNGRYLTQINPSIITIGIDRCSRLSQEAKSRHGEVLVCDNLDLPFLDGSFDAVLSLAVIHHFATTERRIKALRELARILRIGGRVIITVWALEQKNRRFESQDVLIPWQMSKNRTLSYSDEEENEDFIHPYNAYTEDSTNSSRSAEDGDSSSLSSSSPGESCYSFVRRALQKLAGRKQNWFLESWTSKDTKNDSSIDNEDAKDLPIELRRLEDFEDNVEPPLTNNFKSRSLGSILFPPPRQIVRSRSSVPALGTELIVNDAKPLANYDCQTTKNMAATPVAPSNTIPLTNNTLNRRPKLIKQKQSLCDDEDDSFHMISSYNSANKTVVNTLHSPLNPVPKKSVRKQSSLNDELMASNRLREKERVRKRIQKQTSLNESFLGQSVMFGKRLQIIREGFTTSFKSSTGSLERATKNGLNKIMQNIKSVQTQNSADKLATADASGETKQSNNCQQHHHQHHHHQNQNQNQRVNQNATLYGSHFVQMIQRQLSTHKTSTYAGGPVVYCNNVRCLSTACYCSTYQHGCPHCLQGEDKSRRHSHESGSDSSKDSSLQSDTSVESEDSFASVIYIPKPELQQQQQQQLQYKQQHQNSNSSSSNSSSSNGRNNCCCMQQQQQQQQQRQSTTIANCGTRLHHHHHYGLSSAPTSPLIMPCPPTPAHSPAAAQMSVTSPPQTMAAVSGAMDLLKPKPQQDNIPLSEHLAQPATSCFNFDEVLLRKQEPAKPPPQAKETIKITREIVRGLPPIPKFRKQQSLQMMRPAFPIVRRSSASGAITTTSIPKLLTLELFNPATDDLDSDTSEASSPDSVDSVISAHKSISSANDEQETQLENNKINTNLPDEFMPTTLPVQTKSSQQPRTKEECAEFAGLLSAKLLECEQNNTQTEFVTLDNVKDVTDYVERSKSELNDILALRAELRERRLMLANLSTQPSQQHSSNSSSTSSLSSQTRSSCDEDIERSYMLQLYENLKINKFNNKRNRQLNLHPEAAYLLQDDSDYSLRDDYDEVEHDVILEEDEDIEADEMPQETKLVAENSQIVANVEEKAKVEVLENSDSSSASLESPSQGGALTHHRYYHVFREGELDALINNHVSSLHIVSSYYERASWCIVAEKVQLWTI